MHYNDQGADFKYLIVNERDKRFGLSVTTVGFQAIRAGSVYPPRNHPDAYYFTAQKGRVLHEYQLVYITKGRGTFASDTTPSVDISKGQILFLFPGQWHTYAPLQKTGWNEYYIGFEGPIIDNLVKNSFISKENQILDIGINEELASLFARALEVAEADKTAAQQYLSGIVLHIMGAVLAISQNKRYEVDNAAQKIESAKIIMHENVRKFGKRLYTSPSKDAQKRFRAKIGDIVKGHKMCKQESLIRMLNPVITGWGNYYRYGASTDAFHGCDNHIYNLTKKWALRRHPKKRKSWVADKYWHEIRGRKWTFAWKYETKSKKVNYLTLKRLSDIHYTPYKQIKGEANPFDPEYDDYFFQRKEQQMLESLKGRKSLLYLWNKQNRICPLCGKEIDCTKAWNVNEISVGGSIVRQLVHNNCYKRNKRKC